MGKFRFRFPKSENGKCTFLRPTLITSNRSEFRIKQVLEGWYYMLVEFTKGSLPWRLITDRAAVQNSKKHARAAGLQQFLLDCPPIYAEMLSRIDNLKFEEQPPYEDFYKILDKVTSMYRHWETSFILRSLSLLIRHSLI